jgi:hypothetical protein
MASEVGDERGIAVDCAHLSCGWLCDGTHSRGGRGDTNESALRFNIAQNHFNNAFLNICVEWRNKNLSRIRSSHKLCGRNGNKLFGLSESLSKKYLGHIGIPDVMRLTSCRLHSTGIKKILVRLPHGCVVSVKAETSAGAEISQQICTHKEYTNNVIAHIQRK